VIFFGDNTEQYKTAADLELLSETIEDHRKSGAVASAIADAEAELAGRPADDPTRRKPKPALTLKRKADDGAKGKKGKKSKKEEESEEDEEESDDEEEESDDDEDGDTLTAYCTEAEEGLDELKQANKAAKAAREKIQGAISGAGACNISAVAELSSSGWGKLVKKLTKLEVTCFPYFSPFPLILLTFLPLFLPALSHSSHAPLAVSHISLTLLSGRGQDQQGGAEATGQVDAARQEIEGEVRAKGGLPHDTGVR